MYLHKFYFFALLLIITQPVFMGCSKNTLLSSEVTPDAHKITGPIFIVGVFHNRTAHNIYEDSLAVEFEQAGVKAFVSHNYGFGTAEPDQDKLQKVMAQTKAKTIIFTHLLDESKIDNRIAPIGDRHVVATYWDNVHGYHSIIYERSFAPESHTTTTTDFIETTLFNWESDERIWTGRTKSKNLNSFLADDDKQLEDILINALKKAGLL